MATKTKPALFANNHCAVASSRTTGGSPIKGSRAGKQWSVSCTRPECDFKISHAGTKRDAERAAEDHNRYAEALPPVESGYEIGQLVIIHVSWADMDTYATVVRTFGWSKNVDVIYWSIDGAEMIRSCHPQDVRPA